MTARPEGTPRGPSLRIVSVNDVYSLDNLPRLATLVRRHAEGPADRFLVVMAGDFLAPSLLSSLDHGRGMIDCMNAVPITHTIFGNHEADIDIRELRARVQEFRGTWLNTNMPSFTPALPTHEILEIASPGGRTVRVGLLGLLVHVQGLYRRGAFGGYAIEPANEAAVRWADRLVREEGCACVIPITHQSRDDDLALARAQREPRFPVILGGHEHEVLLDDVDGCWVVKAGTDAESAAIVDLVWPAEAPAAGAPDLPVVTVRIEGVAGYPEDAAMRARVDRHMQIVRDLDAATLLRLPPGKTLSSIGTRSQQTSLGELVCSRIRDVLQADGCLFNGGGIRGGREYRERFTYGDLKAEVPFSNEVVVVAMPGRVVREAVAASRSRAPAQHGGYLQIDDRMATDAGGALIAIGGLPLVDDREYRIATVRGLLGGMDDIAPLVRFAQEHPEKVPPADSGREPKLVLVESFAVELWRQLGPFESIDEDRDGAVSAEELRAAVSRATSETPSEVVVGEMLRALDRDGDRRVSLEEAGALAPLKDAPAVAREEPRGPGERQPG
ncbi:5'-nucleotidase C-terminal domain-containing protein [Sorangium sp. So ce1024]|uniref:5'-nucleotidase C-terminal domain-containing protein n=1 Tax=Sorangium sp. So ce1024 TaxID=3133327 RepID=UPI003F0B8E98